jgi:2-amino-4-hydroxy-6-hydroxymethyldihydropteridine diphosphokinase
MGANLGDAQSSLAQAAQALARAPGISGLRLSPLYRSAPVDAGGPDYTNAVAVFDTVLAPHAVLALLQETEQAHGRERPYRNAPRTLDLDLLLYGDETIDTPDLTVPHPRMHQRAFVLRPLADLAPGLGLAQGSLAELLAACQDQDIEPLPARGNGQQAGSAG